MILFILLCPRNSGMGIVNVCARLGGILAPLLLLLVSVELCVSIL